MLDGSQFLILDNDSQTNFKLLTLPRTVACGYQFCERQEPSTSSESTSDKSLKVKWYQKFTKPHHYMKDNAKKSLKFSEENIYHQSTLKKHFSNMQNAYAVHKIDLAYSQAQKVKKISQKAGHILSKEQRFLIEKIEKEMKDVWYYCDILHQGGWQLKKQKRNLKVSTKMENRTVGVLVEAYLDVEIQNFFSVLVEIDLMKEWMPFMQTSKLQKIVARNCRIGHSINNIPFLAKRQSFFQGIGYDRVDYNNTILLYTRSLNNCLDLQRQLGYTVHQTEGAVQLDYKYLILQYKPQTPRSGWLKLALNVDMRLSVPMFILGPATENFGIDFYRNILKIAKHLKGSKWQKKIKQNPQFFNLLQYRIRQHFGLPKK